MRKGPVILTEAQKQFQPKRGDKYTWNTSTVYTYSKMKHGKYRFNCEYPKSYILVSKEDLHKLKKVN